MDWGRVSSLEAAGALVVVAPILGSISNPPGSEGWSWVGCGCHQDPISDQIPTCLVPHIGGIKLLCHCSKWSTESCPPAPLLPPVVMPLIYYSRTLAFHYFSLRTKPNKILIIWEEAITESRNLYYSWYICSNLCASWYPHSQCANCNLYHNLLLNSYKALPTERPLACQTPLLVIF